MRGFGRVLGIVQAGGSGSRMDVLTRERAKPALAFAGSYKLIDFALSSFANAEIADVWVSVAYLASTLDDHIGHGRPWNLDRTRGGYRRLVPEQGRASSESGFASGNADNLVQVAGQIRDFEADVVIVMSADHVFRLDLADVIADHLERGAECTIVTAQATATQASTKAVVQVGDDRRVTGFDYKPDEPEGRTVATEIFVYDPEVLLSELTRLRHELAHAHDNDEAADEGCDDEGSRLGDFGEHLVPALVARGKTFAHPIGHYWRDLGRPEEYYQAHRDVLAGRVDVFDDPGYPIGSRWPELPPAMVRAEGDVTDSLLSPGCVVRGEVVRSVLGPGVVIEAGAVVRDSILGAHVRVCGDAHVRTAILDESTWVGRGAQVGATPAATRVRDADIALVGRDSRISGGSVVDAGARLEPGSSV
ncbi:sugar phosphate nucleotidyltransferase [Propioniciclava soli]|uniref:Sugar phosphate nucleotidyltransferase n=1 Tax=Propioniciclava soli TaxID=2775081 RepID=A0ABZ3C8W7_9ACTN